MKVWEYTNNTKNRYGKTLCQIRYIRENKLGGWVEKTCTIPQSNNIFVDSDSMIHGNVVLNGNVRLINTEVFGDSKIYDVCGIELKNCVWFNVNFHNKDSSLQFGYEENNRFFGNGSRTSMVADDDVVEFQTHDIQLSNDLYLSNSSRIYDVFYYLDDRYGYSVKVGCQKHSIKTWRKNYKKIAFNCNFPEQNIISGLKILDYAENYFKNCEKILSDYFGNNYRENGKFAKKPTIHEIFKKKS